MSQIGITPKPERLEAARRLARHLGDAGAAETWCEKLAASPQGDAPEALRRLMALELPLDLLSTLLEQVGEYFASHRGFEAAVVNLEAFFSRVRSPLALATLFERDLDALPILLRVLATPGPLAQIILADVESFDLLRLVQGKAVSREAQLADLSQEMAALEGERHTTALLSRFRARELLRIGYGLLASEASAATISAQLSQLAEVMTSALLQHEVRHIARHSPRGEFSLGLAAFGFGDFGSQSMHFESTLDCLALFDASSALGELAPDKLEDADRLLRAIASQGQGESAWPFNVKWNLRSDLATTRPADSMQRALRQLDQFGRTWQRLQWISARALAGDAALAQAFLRRLEPWVYRRRLSDADVDGLLFQYRKWRRTARQSTIEGLLMGLRILQLTLGGDHHAVRCADPIEAIEPLAKARAFDSKDAERLAADLEVLLKHRLLAQLGVEYHAASSVPQSLDSAQQVIASALERVFGEVAEPPIVSELIMDPLPAPADVEAAITPFGFEQPQAAGFALSQLAQESSPFLSTRHARHFLSKIAPALAESLAKCPSPDHALLVLSRVVESLGAKGALWELFLSNPPSMELCVRLCAYAPYLSDILIASPGFIDELLDSLQLARLPSLAAMESRLDDLCKGAELEHAIHEFKNALHLRIGVRDILGKEEITSTHQSLAQTAEAILRRVVAEQYKELLQKHGKPMADAAKEPRECRHALLVAGKVGALEPNYHSEIDFVLIYEADGMTQAHARSAASVSNAHFFGQLAQRTSRRLSSRGRLGQLYAVNSDLRPLGPQGPLTASLEALRRYYSESPRSWRDLLWLTKARPAGGDAALAAEIMATLHQAITQSNLTSESVQEFADYRRAQSENASPLNLKRANGGTQHIELLVQFLQLAFAAKHPKILTPGTLDAIARLATQRLLSSEEARLLDHQYRFLRSIELRVRLMNAQARHDLPENEADLRSLAKFVGAQSAEALREACATALAQVEQCVSARETSLEMALAADL